jgi:hypothetical protein
MSAADAMAMPSAVTRSGRRGFACGRPDLPDEERNRQARFLFKRRGRAPAGRGQERKVVAWREGVVGTGPEFERDLRKALPRGLKGREPELPRTRWAEMDDLSPDDWDYDRNRSGLFLGYRGARQIGWQDDRHALTVAGTRAGKGTSLIVPNLLRYPGSVLVIDPKGELGRITGRRRAQLGELVVLDPFRENGRWASGSFNPLDELDADSREVIDEAGAIAQALVI